MWLKMSAINAGGVKSPPYLLVITVAGSKEEALMISKVVVDSRLAGCAQVSGPIESLYWWKGKTEKAEEWMCFMKSREDLFLELESEIRKVHSYDIPEIISLPIMHSGGKYFDWLEKELKSSQTG